MFHCKSLHPTQYFDLFRHVCTTKLCDRQTDRLTDASDVDCKTAHDDKYWCRCSSQTDINKKFSYNWQTHPMHIGRILQPIVIYRHVR